MYQNPYNQNYYVNNGDRQFLIPFLGGALIGGAAVGLTRPRPIYNVAPNQPMYYQPTGPYGYSSYNYYYPYGR
jgi:hypothetical protein